MYIGRFQMGGLSHPVPPQVSPPTIQKVPPTAVVFAGPPRYGGDFRSWRGIAPRLQTPQRGKLPSENSPPVRGGFCDFGGGSEGSVITRKPLASPPVRGGVQYFSEGRLGDGQKELFFVCVTQFLV